MTIRNMNHASDRIIQLEPLLHQVGGHASMFVLDAETVCKPLIGRELKFYRSLPPEIKKYTPEFKGRLPVRLEEGLDGPYLTALPSEEINALAEKSNSGKYSRRLSRGIEFDNDIDDDEDEDLFMHDYPSPPSTPPPPDSPNLSASLYDKHNAWLQQCHKAYLDKLRDQCDASRLVECIMLENLTFKVKYPCILDLKMGTRQYGDDAPESKQKSQTAKAQNTTTITLGVRLAGMQVFNHEKKTYSCLDKYQGQRLSEDNFKETLRQFLFNGRRLRTDVLDAITTKLKELRDIVIYLDSFRFFTSSLLILYDGSDPVIIKNSRDSEKRSRCSNENEQVDLSSRKDFLHCDVSHRREHRKDVGPNNREQAVGGGREKHESCCSTKLKGRHKSRSYKPKVDIRLIDFAHATHKAMGDAKEYHGPDEGILMGLQSLIRIFKEIKES